MTMKDVTLILSQPSCPCNHNSFNGHDDDGNDDDHDYYCYYYHYQWRNYVGGALMQTLPRCPSRRKKGANNACHNDTKHINLKKNHNIFMIEVK